MTSCKFIIFIISMAERYGSMKILTVECAESEKFLLTL